MKASRRRGMSLLEAMVSLGLVALAMGLVGGLLRGTAEASKKVETRDRSMEALHTLRRLQTELREAQAILPGSEDVLSFQKVKPTVAFPSAFTDIARTYDPDADFMTVEVRRVEATTLAREADGNLRILMRDVGEFRVERDAASVRLQIIVLENDGRVVDHQAVAYLPAVVR